MRTDDLLVKYPRTRHLQGSRLQKGDEDLSQCPFSEIRGRHVVLEEKLDGANSGVSFVSEGDMRLQSRGHFLTGGYRERHFDLFKQWAAAKERTFWEVLGTRYIMYGEWLYAKHTVYYDALPHYFMEFDVFDRETGKFLDTPSRHRLLEGTGVRHVPVLYSGAVGSIDEISRLIGVSNYITDGKDANLREDASKVRGGSMTDCIVRETDPTRLMEGIYIKVEDGGEVVDRLKYVRASFLQNVLESETHWLDRPIVPNRVACTINELFL